MTKTFIDHRFEKESKGVRYHEAGHAAIARSNSRGIRVRAKITSVDSGKTKLTFPNGTDDLVKYQVSISGCLSEAKALSGREIDVAPEKIAVLAAQITTCLKLGMEAFPVDVCVDGDSMQQAACNPGDFEWLKGKAVNRHQLTQAAVLVGNAIRTPEVADDIDVIARMLLQFGEYDSNLDL